MWRQAKQLQPNLSFTKATGEEAFAIVYSRVKDQWDRLLTPEEQKGWVARITKRFRAQARAICHAELKNSKTGWLLTLWQGSIAGEDVAAVVGGSQSSQLHAETTASQGEESEQEPEEADEGQPSEERPSVKRPASASAAKAIKRLASDEAVGSARCMHGYDVEVKAAWKADASRPHDGELSTKVDFDPDAEDTSLARATFENGDSVVIPGLTVCEARGLKVLLLQHRGALWEGRTQGHGPSPSALGVEWIARRCWHCTSTATATKQICMVHIKLFRGDSDSQNKALDFLQRVAGKYAKNEVLVDGLFHLRDAELRKIGLDVPRGAASRGGSRPSQRSGESLP